MSDINHAKAKEFAEQAQLFGPTKNLARCYLDLREKARAVLEVAEGKRLHYGEFEALRAILGETGND